MKLKVKRIELVTGKPVCMIHKKTAKKMSLHVGNRVLITDSSRKKIISVIDTVEGIIRPGEIAVSEEILEILDLNDGDIVEVRLIDRPKSVDYIRKKLEGHALSKAEINEIVNDIANNTLTEVDVAFFISAVYTHEMNIGETKNLIDAMVNSGNVLKLRGKICDKHCIGGIAGNRTTPIIVSICASAGLIMPKTSSRAITSAAGTSDSIETMARVDFKISEIKNIIKKTNACFVWGGALGLAPVDDKIIRVEKMENIDSTSQLLASILSKKISVGSRYIVIDIPFGKSAKVDKNQAQILRKKFLDLGRRFNLKISVALTDGNQPIGNGIGPVLEMNDTLKVLKQEDSPKDLEEKSILLASILLELSGKAVKGKGIEIARDILYSGKAFEKFKQIIKAQKGKIKILKPSNLFFDIISEKNSRITHLDNDLINKLARRAGCPEDKEAGVYIFKKKSDIVKKGEILLRIYATSNEKLEYAKKFFNDNRKRTIIY